MTIKSTAKYSEYVKPFFIYRSYSCFFLFQFYVIWDCKVINAIKVHSYKVTCVSNGTNKIKMKA